MVMVSWIEFPIICFHLLSALILFSSIRSLPSLRIGRFDWYVARLLFSSSPFLFPSGPLSVALGERAHDRAAAGPDTGAAD